jgi:hypothetical protein
MKHFFAFFLFSIFCFSSGAQSIKVYKNGPGDTTRRSIVKVLSLPGGARVHLGSIETSEASADATLTKVDVDGTIIWQKYFGGSGLDAINNFVRLRDGGFAIIGYTDDTNISGDDGDMLIIKTDSLGVPQWAKKFGGSAFEEGFGISELSNGELLAFGRTDSFSGLTVMALGAKFSPTGDLVWQKVFRFGSQSSYLYKAFENSSTEVVVCGYAWDNIPGAQLFDPLFVKINPVDGEIMSSSRLRMSNLQIIYDWERDTDGSIYWAGVSSSGAANQNILGKVSPVLTPVWSKSFSNARAQRIWDIDVLQGGDVLYAGFILKTTSDQSRKNGAIGRVSSAGVFQQSIEFDLNDTNSTELTGIALSNGKAYAVGLSYMYGNTYGAGISIEVDPDDLTQICNGTVYTQTTVNRPSTNIELDTVFDGGTVEEVDMSFGDNNEVLQTICTYTSVEERVKSSDILFYPNPGTGVFKVKFPDSEKRTIKVYQANGIQVVSKELTDQEAELNLERFPSGIFKVLVSTDQNVFQTTLVKK